MAMNKIQMKETAKQQVMEEIKGFLSNGVQIDKNEFGFTTEVEGQKIVVTLKATAKNWDDTKQSDAFDLTEAAENYKFTVAERERKAAEAEQKKQEKIAKAKKSK